MAFHPYKANECFKDNYIKVPKELFVSPLYSTRLNSDSKLLYGFLLDRLSLSIKNNWIDKESNVYLIFTRKSIQKLLNLSDKTVTKAFKELNDCELIYEKKQQCSKPNLIYIGKISHLSLDADESRKNYDSEHGKIPTPESENLRLNKTNNKKTNINNNFDSKKLDNRFFDDSGQYENLDRFIVNFQDYIKEEEGGL